MAKPENMTALPGLKIEPWALILESLANNGGDTPPCTARLCGFATPSAGWGGP